MRNYSGADSTDQTNVDIPLAALGMRVEVWAVLVICMVSIIVFKFWSLIVAVLIVLHEKREFKKEKRGEIERYKRKRHRKYRDWKFYKNLKRVEPYLKLEGIEYGE